MNEQTKPKLYKVMNWDYRSDLYLFDLTLAEAMAKLKELEAEYPNLTFQICEM